MLEHVASKLNLYLHQDVHQVWIVRIWKISLVTLTGFFIGKTAIAHSAEIQSLQFQPWAWEYLLGAIALILLSEWIAGLLWYWVLEFLGQSVPLNWAVTTFFKTTLAKYLPGNVWHLVGRVNASREFGVAIDRVSLSVILEPLFMIAGGLLVALLFLKSAMIQIGALGAVLLLLHPWGMSGIAKFLTAIKHLKPTQTSTSAPEPFDDIDRYPIREIITGAFFMLLRGGGFCLTLMALQPLFASELPQIISGFSLSWLLSIVLPAPGGMGVFESAAIQVLDGISTPGLLLSAVVLYRFLCMIAETLGVALVVGLPWLWKKSPYAHHSWSAIAIPACNSGSSINS